jgi:hypothetical protein
VAFVFFQSGVDGTASLPNVDFATFTGDVVNAWCPEFDVVFNGAVEVGQFPLGETHGLDVVSGEDSVHTVECGTDVRQEGDRFRLVAVRLAGPQKTIESSVDLSFIEAILFENLQ